MWLGRDELEEDGVGEGWAGGVWVGASEGGNGGVRDVAGEGFE